MYAPVQEIGENKQNIKICQRKKSTRPRTTVRNSDVQVCIVWESNF